MSDGNKYEIKENGYNDDVDYEEIIENDEYCRNESIIKLTNLETDEEKIMSVWNFMYELDCTNTTYEKSRFLKYANGKM